VSDQWSYGFVIDEAEGQGVFEFDLLFKRLHTTGLKDRAFSWVSNDGLFYYDSRFLAVGRVIRIR